MKRIVPLLALAVALAACAPKIAPEDARPHVDHAGDPATSMRPTRDVYVLLLILDGGRADDIYGAAERGELPNLKEHVFDRGVRVKNAVTVFPSVTTCGHQAFITGLLPGHAGITGLDWFDRSSGRVTDYLSWDLLEIKKDMLSKTRPRHADELFTQPDNLLDDLKGIPRAAIYESFHMDVPDRWPYSPLSKPLVYMLKQDHHAVTRDAADAIEALYTRPADQIPRFVMATFLGHDIAQHHHGSGSEEMRAEMAYEDKRFGDIVARMKAAGIWDKTYVVLTSDHGQHPTGEYVSIPRLLRDVGLRPRGFYSARVNTFASQIAITSANIYLNKGDWRDAVTLEDLRSFPRGDGKRIDLISGLVKHPAIELAIVPEAPDRVHVLAEGKHATITRRSFQGTEYFAYDVDLEGGDPLGYSEDAATRDWVGDGRFHSADDWGHASAETQHPDALLQLTQLFDGDRAGDVVITAKTGWHFRPRDYRSSHGGITRDDMRVPLVLGGPDVARGEIDFARTIDVYPTLRRIFGMKVSTERVDGRPLDEALPFVNEELRVAADGRRKDHFAALAALESLLSPGDALGAPAEDPAELFRELKDMDYAAFSAAFRSDVERDAALRREAAEQKRQADERVRELKRMVKEDGHDDYNDGVSGERRELKRVTEQSFILERTLTRLDARLARASRLQQVLDLVRVAGDVDELRHLFVMAQRPAFP